MNGSTLSEPFHGYFSDRDFANSISTWLPSRLSRLCLEELLIKGPFVDLGCGLGTVIAAVEKKYPRTPMIGVDINHHYLHQARSIVSGGVSLVAADLRSLPFASGSVPVVFSHKIYDYCNETTYPEIAGEIARILSPGGIYVSVEPMDDYNVPFLVHGLVIVDRAHFYAILQRPRVIGRQIGPYVIAAPLGRSGMDEVFRAHDRRLGRDVISMMSKADCSSRVVCPENDILDPDIRHLLSS